MAWKGERRRKVEMGKGRIARKVKTMEGEWEERKKGWKRSRKGEYERKDC